MQIYLARNNVQAGPYSLNELNSMLADGQVVLTDLAWHTGMDSWKTVGDMTNGQLFYADPSQPNNDLLSNANNNEFSNNSNTVEANNTAVESMLSDAITNKNVKVKVTEVKVATKGKRISATMFDFSLFIVCLIPMLIHFKIPEKVTNNMTINELNQLLMELNKDIPYSAILVTNIAIMLYSLLQLVLSLSKGQTIGKSIVGIRVVDNKSLMLPNDGAALFKRFTLSALIFGLLTFFLGPLALLVYAAMIWTSKEGVLFYDKMSNTIMVEAHPYQIKNNKPKN